MIPRDDMCRLKRKGCFCAKPKGDNHLRHVCICGDDWVELHAFRQHPSTHLCVICHRTRSDSKFHFDDGRPV